MQEESTTNLENGNYMKGMRLLHSFPGQHFNTRRDDSKIFSLSCIYIYISLEACYMHNVMPVFWRESKIKNTKDISYAPMKMSLLHRCHWLPRSLTHVNSPGNISTTTVVGSKTLHHWDKLFVIPPIDITPKDTRFEPEEGGSIPAWWTSSGHLVVEPCIDGRKLGFMILDTGKHSRY